MANKLMVARLDARPGELPRPPGYALETASYVDPDRLGAAYFAAYGVAVYPLGIDQARADVRAMFDGEYGELLPAASPVALSGGAVAGAVLTVHRAPWPDVPDGPFVIDVFTVPGHRRVGLARHLLRHAMAAARSPRDTVIGLRVELANTAAQALYLDCGFTDGG